MKLIIDQGPIPRQVKRLNATSGVLTISFFTQHAATVAHLASGWPFHGDRAFEITATDASITVYPLDDPAASSRRHDS